ncbi:ABC transporter substrate-binding protein [Reinekea marina]|nr:ABC transporter substrate-binding protein [Reinekea marina]MDN3648735.1 ABC transporter substrate-binding protein [Reinekea marina]
MIVNGREREMIIKPILSALVLMMLLISQATAFTPSRSAQESVEAGVKAILSVVRKYEGDQSEEKRLAYLDEVSEVLEPVIGYTIIARRVMGDAFDNATREQKIRFLDVFKRSMINTYAGGIYTFGAYEVEVLPSQDDKKDTYKNTRVYMDVISPEGPKYSLVQSVYYSKEEEDWKMQNAIFNGINLGVTFRTQFQQIYKETEGDLDATIAEWERITEEAYSSTKFR